MVLLSNAPPVNLRDSVQNFSESRLVFLCERTAAIVQRIGMIEKDTVWQNTLKSKQGTHLLSV